MRRGSGGLLFLVVHVVGALEAQRLDGAHFAATAREQTRGLCGAHARRTPLELEHVHIAGTVRETSPRPHKLAINPQQNESFT